MAFVKLLTSLQPALISLSSCSGLAAVHHSFEDLHQPILATYHSICQFDNITLVAGSGFGSADNVWEYMTGDWSMERFGVQFMPPFF